MCAKILKGIEQELNDRTCAYAFPAATVDEEAAERGPLDEPEDDELQVIGTRLGEAAEREQELMDSLRLDGFPQK